MAAGTDPGKSHEKHRKLADVASPEGGGPSTPVDRQYAFSFSHHAPIEAAGRIIAAERLKEISRGRQVGLFSLVVAPVDRRGIGPVHQRGGPVRAEVVPAPTR